MHDEFYERFDRIEQRNRLLTALLVAVVVGIALLTATNPPLSAQDRTMRVSEIVVVDSNGVERVTDSAERKEGPTISPACIKRFG
jgi:hypothetical protein